MRFIASCIDASLLYFETCQCVSLHVALTRLYRIPRSRSVFPVPQKALGIGAASFASFSGAGCGDGIWERDLGAGGSEQRYSGKPDGVAGTPKTMYNLQLTIYNVGLLQNAFGKIILYIYILG